MPITHCFLVHACSAAFQGCEPSVELVLHLFLQQLYLAAALAVCVQLAVDNSVAKQVFLHLYRQTLACLPHHW